MVHQLRTEEAQHAHEVVGVDHRGVDRERRHAAPREQHLPAPLAGPAVHLVLYRRPCGVAAADCVDYGFIEAVDVDGVDTDAAFDAFKSGVLARNPASLVPGPPTIAAGGGGGVPTASLASTYVAADGRRIEFDVTAHIRDDDRTGLEAINGVAEKDWDDWDLANGDIVQKNDWPLVTITNAHFPGQAVTLDFRGREVPKFNGP